MICKNCGNPVDDTASFCGKCGAEVSAAESTVTCTNCGNVMPSGMAFCDKCGQLVRKSNPIPNPIPRPIPPAPPPVPAPIPNPIPRPVPTPVDNAKTLFIWSIVFAFLAPIIAWNWYDALGLVMSFASVIIGIRSKKVLAIILGICSAVVVVSMFAYAYS